ncbi:MAG: TSUP family transporter [Candidatus Omnitrophota bacterium]|nr:TSUP family transporter [Candidatus Omnitrophota bacterium]
MNILIYLVVGLIAGIVSGLIGIGGGIVIVPCLIYVFKFSQHAAQGTTLAMLVPPIGLLAAWAYYKGGHVNLPVAGLLCLGFVVGGYFGAKFAVGLPEVILRKIFGACLLVISGYMLVK